jgi:hypothetical protein
MKKIILAATVITIVFTACKKSKVEEAEPAPPTHLGLWKGKFSTSTTTQPTSPMFALLTKDGIAKIYNGADTATAIKSLTGYWVLAGNAMGIVYDMPNSNTKYSIRFLADDKFTKSTGEIPGYDVWGTGNAVAGAGFTAIGNISFTKP